MHKRPSLKHGLCTLLRRSMHTRSKQQKHRPPNSASDLIGSSHTQSPSSNAHNVTTSQSQFRALHVSCTQPRWLLSPACARMVERRLGQQQAALQPCRSVQSAPGARTQPEGPHTSPHTISDHPVLLLCLRHLQAGERKGMVVMAAEAAGLTGRSRTNPAANTSLSLITCHEPLAYSTPHVGRGKCHDSSLLYTGSGRCTIPNKCRSPRCSRVACM
jgi:hypothetical protein